MRLSEIALTETALVALSEIAPSEMALSRMAETLALEPAANFEVISKTAEAVPDVACRTKTSEGSGSYEFGGNFSVHKTYFSTV